MKPEVYILLLANGQYYVGSTIDLERRILEHNDGRTASIKYKLPAKVVFRQEYPSITEARRIEYKLKGLKSKKLIERIIFDKIIRIK